jgi:hypothetical protein
VLPVVLDVGVDLVGPRGVPTGDSALALGSGERFASGLLALLRLLCRQFRLLATLAGFDSTACKAAFPYARGSQEREREQDDRNDDDDDDEPSIHGEGVPR